MVAPRRVAVVTGGGDCPGLNAVIRALVRVLVARSGIEVVGIARAFHGLLEDDWAVSGTRPLTLDHIDELLVRGGTVLGTSNRGNPLAYVSRHEPHAPPRDLSPLLLERVRALGIEGVVSIGGDGSMAIAAELSARGLPLIGVPKSIDNDLGATDQTFGFDTALHVITDALDRLRDTAASHQRVMVLEVMGRNAGWLALHGGIAGGADVILLPEIPYSTDAVVDAILKVQSAHRRHALVVVGEGATELGRGARFIDQLAGGMPRLGGAAVALEAQLKARLDQEVRVTVLGHVQRGGAPSPYDRVLATRYGRAAAELAEVGDWGRMVSLRNNSIVSVPFREVPRTPRLVDPLGDLVTMARAVGIRFGDAPIEPENPGV